MEAAVQEHGLDSAKGITSTSEQGGSLRPSSGGAVPSRREDKTKGWAVCGWGGAERGLWSSLPFLLDALLFVAPGIHVEVEVVPLVAGWEGNGLPEREADRVDDPLPTGLAGAHADSGGAAGGTQEVGRGGEVMELPVVQDALPDGMAELLRDLEAHQILQGKEQGLTGQSLGNPGGLGSGRSSLWATLQMLNY